MLRYVVEHAGLALFAELGMVLFLIVFVSVLIGAIRRSKPEVERLSRMALDNEDTNQLEPRP
jgi:hypothetical protein